MFNQQPRVLILPQVLWATYKNHISLRLEETGNDAKMMPLRETSGWQREKNDRREKDTHLLYSTQALNHHQTVNQLLQERMWSETIQQLPLAVIIHVHAFRPFLCSESRPQQHKSAEATSAGGVEMLVPQTKYLYLQDSVGCSSHLSRSARGIKVTQSSHDQ